MLLFLYLLIYLTASFTANLIRIKIIINNITNIIIISSSSSINVIINFVIMIIAIVNCYYYYYYYYYCHLYPAITTVGWILFLTSSFAIIILIITWIIKINITIIIIKC